MIKLLSASALAITLTMPAAHASHRHRHVVRMAYRHHHHHGVHHLARRHTGWRHDAANRYRVREFSFGGSYAEADWRDHDGRYVSRPAETHSRVLGFRSHGLGPRPRAWCGWYARQLVGQDPGPQFNLARNWAHWGHAASPGVGVMVVWPHHVGMIIGRASNGEWIVKSGNDGHRTRERARSIAGAIAFRAG